MLLKCLECNYKYGNIAVLKYHYESYHKDKTDNCMCGNIILSGICANNFSPWCCSLKKESSSSSSSSSGSSSIFDSNSNSDPNPNPILNPNPNPNLNLSPEVLIRSCNRCNYVKPLTDFDESKYTCKSCTSAKVNCPYCASVVRYDGIRAHVKKQHPDVDIPTGFSRNLSQKTINPSWQSKTVSHLVISQTEESCSCKYYKFVPFLINNGINLETYPADCRKIAAVDSNKHDWD